jgi:hypothetical protein
MVIRCLVLGALCLMLAGCGEVGAGTYVAEVRKVSDPPNPPPRGYTLEDVQQKLRDEPQVIDLRSNGRFETRRGERVVWEGTWRTEDNQLILRAEVVNGVSVGSRLQDDRKYSIEDGAIIDQSVYGAYGLHLVYRRS